MARYNRRKVRKSGSHFTLKAKLGVLATAIIVATSIALPSIASENTDANASLSGRESVDPAVSIENQVQAVNADMTSCADPLNVNGLANAQMTAIEDLQKMILTPINTDAMFDVAKQGGCFNTLLNFPDLSVSIPSITSIATSLQNSLIQYATRKVCDAVNDSLTEMLEPMNDLFDNLNKNGQLDLTGRFNKEINDQIYKIDPDIGKVKASSAKTYTWNVGDMSKLPTGYIPNGTAENVENNTATPQAQAQGQAIPQAQTQSQSVLSYTQPQQNQSNEESSSGGMLDFIKKIF